jgi:hypothetical protein
MAETRGDADPCAAHDGQHLRQHEIAKIQLAGKVLRGGGTASGGLRIATPGITLWGLAIQGAGSFAARDFPAT